MVFDKRCSTCKEVKPSTDFGGNIRYKDGLSPRCKKCARQASMDYRNRKKRDRTVIAPNHHNLKKYGLTPEEFSYLHMYQTGVCAICRKKRTLVIDHDHKTLRTRGLLCGSCNRALGLLQDNPKILRAALSYLEVPPIVVIEARRKQRGHH